MMSKPSSDHLFQLINSLSTAEKRYFKLFYSRGQDNSKKKFIRLFNLIDRQQEYSEAKLLKQDKDFKPSQLSNLKAHLYGLILQSLVNYNPTDDVEIKIREHLNYANILYNKALYEQCWRILQKAKQLAKISDKILLQFEIIEFEKKLLTNYVPSDIEESAGLIIKESENLIDAIKNTRNFQNLSLKLYAFYLQIGFIRNSKDFEIANRLLYSSLPVFDEDKLSFNEKMFLYQSFVGYYLFIQDPARAKEYAQKWLDLFENQPEMVVPKIEYYIKALNYMISAQFRLYEYDNFVASTQLFDKIESIKNLKLTYNQRLLIFKYSSVHKINRFFMIGDFTAGTEIIPVVAKELELYQSKLDTHNTTLFYYKFACMYFGDDNFNKTIFWLNKIINAKDVNIRSDIQGFARILNLISHWELENSDLLDYYIRSTYRFLKKKQDFHLYQKFILDFLRKLNNIVPDNITSAFQDLYDNLKPLQGNPYEKRAFVYFDILSWLEGKLKGVTNQEIIRMKAKQKMDRLGIQRM